MNHRIIDSPHKMNVSVPKTVLLKEPFSGAGFCKTKYGQTGSGLSGRTETISLFWLIIVSLTKHQSQAYSLQFFLEYLTQGDALG